jgi:hypothetical protein
MAIDPRTPPQLVRRLGPTDNPVPVGRTTPFQLRATDGAVRVLARNDRRTAFEIENNSAAAIERGYDGGLVVGQGIIVPAGSLYNADGDGVYKGEIFIITAAAGPLDVRVAEEMA